MNFYYWIAGYNFNREFCEGVTSRFWDQLRDDYSYLSSEYRIIETGVTYLSDLPIHMSHPFKDRLTPEEVKHAWKESQVNSQRPN